MFVIYESAFNYDAIEKRHTN